MSSLISCIWFASLLLLASIIALSEGKTFAISWSAEAVAQYSDSALFLSPGDTVILSCPNGSYSNVFRMGHQLQYDSCSCNLTVTEDYDCVASYACFGTPSNNTLELVGTKYQNGTKHYFASFSEGGSNTDAASNQAMGGECVSKNLKLRVFVLIETDDNSVDSVTPSPSPSVTPTASPNAGTNAPDSQSNLDLKIIIVPAVSGILILLVLLIAGIIFCVTVAKKRQDHKLLITSRHAQQGFTNPYFQQDSKAGNELDDIYDVVASNEEDANTVKEERIYDFIGLALPPEPQAPAAYEAVYDVVEEGVQIEANSESAVNSEPLVNLDDQTSDGAVAQQYPLILFDQEIGSEYQQPKKRSEQEGTYHTTVAINLYQHPVKQSKLKSESDEEIKEEHRAEPLVFHLSDRESSENAVIDQRPVLAPHVEGIEEAAIYQHPSATLERNERGVTNADSQAETEKQFEFTQPGLYEVPYIPQHSVQQMKQNETPSGVPKTSTDDDKGNGVEAGRQLGSGNAEKATVTKYELHDGAEYQRSDTEMRDSLDTDQEKMNLVSGEETRCETPTQSIESATYRDVVTLSQSDELAEGTKSASPNGDIYDEHSTVEEDVPVGGDATVLHTQEQSFSSH